MKYHIQTLGCQMNYSDSERISALLEKIGYKKAELQEETDLYIFNTCSIRQKGEDRVYGKMKTLMEWKKRNPRLLVGLTGCMIRKTSSRNSLKEEKDKIFSVIKNLDFAFNTKDLHKLGEVLAEAEPNLEIPEMEELNLDDYLKVTPKYGSSFQAYVPIQTGCDKYCTYCIVPYARGRERSRPMQDIIDECTALVENGCKEILLGGQTVNSYGKNVMDKNKSEFADMEDPFVELLTRIDKLSKKGLNRLRFTSPHPYDFTDKLIEAHAALQTMTPHIHLPVQAGDNDVLKKMNRRYTAEDYKKIIEKFREKLPGCSVTTDIIVGFCGETEEQFEKTYELFKEIAWDFAFLARYSPRPGTVSVKAFEDDIPREEKARRWHKLNDLLEKYALEYNKNLEGKTLEVLVEKYIEETGECEGKSRENKVIQFKAPKELVGQIVSVKGKEAVQWIVKGELAKTFQ
jgi:tRNA-2-methylthio-N6-dimethylallyladenosine synthase